MYCNYCGNKLEDEAIYCPKCGKKVVKESEAAPSYPGETDIAKEKVKDFLGGKALKHGILSLVFPFISFLLWYIGLVAVMVATSADGADGSGKGVGIFILLLSIVAAIIGLGMVNQVKQYKEEYERKFGDATGRVSVGKGLSIGGTVFNIIMLVLSSLFTFIALFI